MTMEHGAGDSPIPGLAAIVDRLGKPPRTVRLLDFYELREVETRMDPQGLAPFHPQAQGVRVNVVNVFGILLPAFLTVLFLPFFPLFFNPDSTGPFWLDVLFRASVAFFIAVAAWMVYSIIRTTRSYIFRAYFIFEPDAIRWRREGFLYRRDVRLPRDEVSRVDLVSNGRGLAVWWLLSSGERLMPFIPFSNAKEASWFSWFFHRAFFRPLTGNVPLRKLEEKLLSGTIMPRDIHDDDDGPSELAEGQPPAIAAPGARDTDRLSGYGGDDPALPPSIRTLAESIARGNRRAFVTLVDRRDWRSALRVLPALALFFVVLFAVEPKEAVDTMDRFKDWLGFVGARIFLVVAATSFLHFLLGRTWLIFTEDRLVRGREWGPVRLTKTFGTDDLEAVELVRKNREGDKYDLFLRFGGGGREELIGNLRAESAERLAETVSQQTESPVVRRMAIMPGRFPGQNTPGI